LKYWQTVKHPADAAFTQQEIGGLYDRLAWVYDAWAALTETRATRRALEIAAVRDGESVLEVAVGTGTAFAELVRHNPNGSNIGIDLSPGMLARAQRRLRELRRGHYTLELASAFDLPVDSGSIDLLLSCYLFDLIAFDEMDEVLAEFRRVLKPGGRMVVVNMTVGKRFGSRIYDRLFRLCPWLMGGCRSIRLSERLRQGGFDIVSREYVQQLLFPSEVILARKVST